jgi:hypothetical protein
LYLAPETEMHLNTMIKETYRKEVGMERRLSKWEILKFGEDLRGVNIACRKGRFWLTQAGDSRDRIVRGGDNFTIRAKGKVIITAVEPCRLMLIELEAQKTISKNNKFSRVRSNIEAFGKPQIQLS